MRPFWYRFTNVVRTAREGPGSSVKRSRVQSQDTPSRWCCLEIAPRQRPTHSHTRRSNCSRPRSWRVIPSSCRLLSTTHWVEMPAWSTPGSHNVGSPIMRCQRTMISSIVAVRACPICNSPVTFGGGMMITNGFLARSILGVKYPFPIQKAYQRSSALPGSYALGISDMVQDYPVFLMKSAPANSPLPWRESNYREGAVETVTALSGLPFAGRPVHPGHHPVQHGVRHLPLGQQRHFRSVAAKLQYGDAVQVRAEAAFGLFDVVGHDHVQALVGQFLLRVGQKVAALGGKPDLHKIPGQALQYVPGPGQVQSQL